MAVRDVVQAAAGVGGDKLYIEDVFSTYLWKGNSSTQAITNGIDLAGEGGLVWIKNRSNAVNHCIFDTERGATNWLSSADTSSQSTDASSLTSFNSDGFSLSSSYIVNNSSYGNYVGWTFRKSPKFFTVVTYTGNGSTQTIPHDLGSDVGCMFVHCYSGASQNWWVWHRSFATPASQRLQLNQTNAVSTDTGIWNNTSPTSTDFYVGAGGGNRANDSGVQYVAYLFAHNDAGGFGDDGLQNVISCGSYTGNGSLNGPVINLGWEPQFILLKSTSNSSQAWWIVDSMRKMSLSDYSNCIRPSSTAAEDMFFSVYPNTSGFQVSTTDAEANESGGTYIYIAIRRPMKSFESGTDVFAIDYQGTGGVLPGYKAPFPVDMGIWKDRDGGGTQITSRLTADGVMYTSNTNAEALSRSYSFDYQNGWFDSSTPDTTRVGWMFRRAPGFFDVVAYKGNGTAGRTVAHNLGVAPELMIVKNRNASAGNGKWTVYNSINGATEVMFLDAIDASSASSVFWNNTEPTSTVFTVGSNDYVNYTNDNYIAYLFASLPGVSKVGSISVASSGTLNVDCGFSNGARFVMLKRSSASSSWYVFDTVRGIVSGNDPYLALDKTNAENFYGANDNIDPYPAGFSIPMNTFSNLEGTGTYIYLAIA